MSCCNEQGKLPGVAGSASSVVIENTGDAGAVTPVRPDADAPASATMDSGEKDGTAVRCASATGSSGDEGAATPPRPAFLRVSSVELSFNRKDSANTKGVNSGAEKAETPGRDGDLLSELKRQLELEQCLEFPEVLKAMVRLSRAAANGENRSIEICGKLFELDSSVPPLVEMFKYLVLQCRRFLCIPRTLCHVLVDYASTRTMSIHEWIGGLLELSRPDYCCWKWLSSVAKAKASLARDMVHALERRRPLPVLEEPLVLGENDKRCEPFAVNVLIYRDGTCTEVEITCRMNETIGAIFECLWLVPPSPLPKVCLQLLGIGRCLVTRYCWRDYLFATPLEPLRVDLVFDRRLEASPADVGVRTMLHMHYLLQRAREGNELPPFCWAQWSMLTDKEMNRVPYFSCNTSLYEALRQHFLEFAEAHAHCIVKQLNEPEEQWEIKPEEQREGAATRTFLKDGIFFQLYTHRCCRKAAQREFRATMQFDELSKDEFHVPLSQVLSFDGHIVLCCALYNLSNDSLAHGSVDGVTASLETDDKVLSKIEAIAQAPEYRLAPQEYLLKDISPKGTAPYNCHPAEHEALVSRTVSDQSAKRLHCGNAEQEIHEVPIVEPYLALRRVPSSDASAAHERSSEGALDAEVNQVDDESDHYVVRLVPEESSQEAEATEAMGDPGEREGAVEAEGETTVICFAGMIEEDTKRVAFDTGRFGVPDASDLEDGSGRGPSSDSTDGESTDQELLSRRCEQCPPGLVEEFHMSVTRNIEERMYCMFRPEHIKRLDLKWMDAFATELFHEQWIDPLSSMFAKNSRKPIEKMLCENPRDGSSADPSSETGHSETTPGSTVIQEFASWLVRESSFSLGSGISTILALMHAKGISYRYLGFVYDAVNAELQESLREENEGEEQAKAQRLFYAMQLIGREILARSVKNEVLRAHEAALRPVSCSAIMTAHLAQFEQLPFDARGWTSFLFRAAMLHYPSSTFYAELLKQGGTLASCANFIMQDWLCGGSEDQSEEAEGIEAVADANDLRQPRSGSSMIMQTGGTPDDDCTSKLLQFIRPRVIELLGGALDPLQLETFRAFHDARMCCELSGADSTEHFKTRYDRVVVPNEGSS